jgi:hypothetical protein
MQHDDRIGPLLFGNVDEVFTVHQRIQRLYVGERERERRDGRREKGEGRRGGGKENHLRDGEKGREGVQERAEGEGDDLTA